MEKRYKALVIEDEIMAYEATEILLYKNGFDCFLASSGNKAQILLDQYDFDLIILDLMFPQENMQGEDILKIIREDQKLNAPVVVLTGDSEVKRRYTNYDLGSSGYFTKPILPSKIDVFTNTVKGLASNFNKRKKNSYELVIAQS